MRAFLINHFDSIITVFVTVLGFIITYLMTKKNFRDEVRKDKIALVAQETQTLPYDICQLMDSMIKDKSKSPDKIVKEYGAILSKVLAYGSQDAVKIAIKMQQLSYSLTNVPNEERFSILAAYALLITQLKYDLTSQVISPESWFQLRMTDYPKLQPKMKEDINNIVYELGLSESFAV
nr:hypothetical protein [Clostridia bacterium]